VYKQKIIKKLLSKALSHVNVLREYHKIVNCQTWARNSCKQFASWERCDSCFPNRLWLKHDFYHVSLFVLTRQELLSSRTSIVFISLLKSIIDDQISEILSLNSTVMELPSDVLHVCPLSFEDFDCSLLHFLQARVDEIMKFKSVSY